MSPNLITDKQRCDALVKACQELYVRYHAALALLQLAEVEDWHRRLDTVACSEVASQLREQLHKEIQDVFASGEEIALQELFAAMPTSKLIQ